MFFDHSEFKVTSVTSKARFKILQLPFMLRVLCNILNAANRTGKQRPDVEPEIVLSALIKFHAPADNTSLRYVFCILAHVHCDNIRIPHNEL